LPKRKKWIVKDRKTMKKVKNGFEKEGSFAASGLKNGTTKAESHLRKRKITLLFTLQKLP